jgi:NhaP-type Na+/H+ or K+/H+ antiporter
VWRCSRSRQAFQNADPIAHGGFVERLSELAVIVALMGAGLKLDRPLGWTPWRPTWRLLAVAMPLTVVVTGVLGWAWSPISYRRASQIRSRPRAGGGVERCHSAFIR